MPAQISTTQRMGILASILVLIFLVNIEYSAVNLALVSISQELLSPLTTLQWLMSGYMLAWGILVIPAGRLADIYGKRKIFILGVVIFTIASALCATATSSWFLIAGRILQGFGGALFVPPCYTLLFSIYPAHKQGMAIGLLGAAAGLGLATGPSIGGALITWSGWRWIFILNIPLCLISISLIAWSTSKETLAQTKEKLDIIGSILFAVGIATTMFALNHAESWGINSQSLWIVMAGGSMTLILFAIQQKHSSNKLISTALFKNPTFWGCLLGFALFQFNFSSTLVIIGLYLQNILQYNTSEAGLIFMTMTLALGVLSPIGGKLVDKMDARIPIVGGMLIMAVALWMASQFSANASLIQVLIALFLVGVGLGITFPSLNAAMMKSVNPKNLNTASGVFIMGGTFGNSIGVIVSTNLVIFLGKAGFLSTIAAEKLPITSTQQSAILQLFSSAHHDFSTFAGMSPEKLQQVSEYFKQAFVDAMSVTMLVGMSFALLAALLGMWLIKSKPQEADSSATGSPEGSVVAA